MRLFEDVEGNSANIFLFNVNNRTTRKRWEICSNLTIKTPERCQWHRSVVGQYKHATVIINRIRVLIGREMLIRAI